MAPDHIGEEKLMVSEKVCNCNEKDDDHKVAGHMSYMPL